LDYVVERSFITIFGQEGTLYLFEFNMGLIRNMYGCHANHDIHQLGTSTLSEWRRKRVHKSVAKTVKGARALLEAGFEYVTDMDGMKLFTKRK
jgi:hypothetical protein